jgi:hypothetical protein
LTFEVQLQSIPSGFGVTVFSDDPNGGTSVRNDARAIREFLGMFFPDSDIKVLIWHPWPPA